MTLHVLRRSLAAYLRLLDASEPPPLHAIAATLETVRPFVSNAGLHLPAEQRALRGELARQTYFASAAHAAAHLRYTRHRYRPAALKAIQRVLVGVLEDARVEWLAAQALPGLWRLWRPLHTAEPAHGGEFRVLAQRLARALADPDYDDPHPWVRSGRELFHADDGEHGQPLHSTDALRRLASRLGNDMGQMRLQFNEKTYVVEPAYRDDNACIWAAAPDQAQALAIEEARSARSGAQGDDGAVERIVPVGPSGSAGPGEAAPEAADGGLISVSYPEWDRLIQRYRNDWCTVIDETAAATDNAAARAALDRYGELIARLQRLLRKSRVDRVVRRRGQPEGDAIDLDMAIRSAVALRSGHSPERNVYQRAERARQSLAVLMLFDLSESINDPAPDGAATLLELTRAAALIGGMTIGGNGDPCAIHGFCSNSRSEVRYRRFVEFDEPFDDAAASRVAAMRGALSTRIGAALRHATRTLDRRREQRRLVLVVTDGVPHDIDIHDPRYLLEDARKAVLEARARQVDVFCITLDRGADGYVGQIFGAGRFLCLDNIARLPEIVSSVYLRLRH